MGFGGSADGVVVLTSPASILYNANVKAFRCHAGGFREGRAQVMIITGQSQQFEYCT
jgi:hypothetical protein